MGPVEPFPLRATTTQRPREGTSFGERYLSTPLYAHLEV
jgi:hypothetical protein